VLPELVRLEKRPMAKGDGDGIATMLASPTIGESRCSVLSWIGPPASFHDQRIDKACDATG
jgi:hypothetical protein